MQDNLNTVNILYPRTENKYNIYNILQTISIGYDVFPFMNLFNLT